MTGKKMSAAKPGPAARGRGKTIVRDVSSAVALGDAFHHDLMNTLQVGVMIQGPGTEILLCNSRALEMLGLREDQVRGRTSLDPDWNAIHEDGSPFPGQTHPSSEAARTLKPVRDVVMGVQRHGTGERIWLLVNATPQLNAGGTLRQVIVTFADISAQKRAERALVEREERLRLALEGGDLGVWDWNVAERTAVVNDRLMLMYGLDPAGPRITLSSWRERVHPEDSERFDRHLEESIHGPPGIDFELEFRVRHAAGHYIWILSKGAVVERAADGSAVRVVGTHLDITERKRFAEVQKIHQDRLNAVINNFPLPIVTTDGSEQFTFLNPAFTETFGYRLEDIPTVADWWTRAYPDPEYRKHIGKIWRSQLDRARQPGPQLSPVEANVICKDGAQKTVLFILAAVAAGPGAERVVVIYDITERKQAERELLEREKRLRLVLHGGDLGLWDYDVPADSIVVNDRFLSMLGLDPGKATISSAEWYALVHPDDRAIVDGVVRDIFFEPTGVDFELEMRAVHREGHYVWILSRGAVVQRAADGSPLRVTGTHMDITERQKLAESQRMHEQRLAAIINLSPVPLAVIDRHQNFTSLNPAFVRTFGYQAQEVQKMEDWWNKAYPDPEYRRKVLAERDAELERVKQTGTPFSPKEVLITCADGSQKTVLASASAFPQSLEEEHLVLFYDITERKRAQALQRETEEFFLEAVERFPGMLSYWSRDLRCKVANPAYREWFGRTPQQMRGVPQQELVDEEIFEKNRPYVQGVLRGENQQFERTIKKADGSLGYCLIQFIAHKRNGEIPGFFLYVTDVTSVRREQERLRNADIALNSISQGVSISTADYRIIWTNHAFESMTGYPCAEVIGRSGHFLQGPGTDPKIVQTMRQALRDGLEFSCEILNYRKDGGSFWNDLSISPVRDAGGQLTHFIGITRDITERRQTREQRALLEAELQQAQKLESVGRLAGGIAHDFNNMLAVILGHAEIATGRTDLPPPVRLALEEIDKAASRSADLTRNLLAFARRQPAAPKVLDLNQRIAGMRTLLERLVGDAIELVWRLNAAPALVRLDPSQIDQIMVNLCVNAKDAIVGRGTVIIETANRTLAEDAGFAGGNSPEDSPKDFRSGSYISLAITDNGCGMDSQTQARIFEPFFTTKEVGKGTGLGLATVYGAVTQNGGVIDVASKPGEGSTFTLYLPVQIAQAGSI